MADKTERGEGREGGRERRKWQPHAVKYIAVCSPLQVKSNSFELSAKVFFSIIRNAEASLLEIVSCDTL